MCFETRIVFACGHEKLQLSSETGPASYFTRCEWANMSQRVCPPEMTGADPQTSTEVMYECMDCLQLAGGLNAKGSDGKDKKKKGKLTDLKKKVKR